MTVFAVERNAPRLDWNPGPSSRPTARQILDLSLAHQLIKAADGELLEVRSGAVELARCPVPVLLVDHDHGRVVLDGVRNVADTAGLLA